MDERPLRTIALAGDGRAVEIIDQTFLPFRLEMRRLVTVDDAAEAIRAMRVRGAPLIGATAAYGMALAAAADPSDAALDAAARLLAATRPTAVNLRWAIDEMRAALAPVHPEARADAGYARAGAIAAEDVATNAALGRHGLALLREIAGRKKPGERLNVLTHCNAGRLAAVDWGTATAPIYMAQEAGLSLHVYVDETRPRLQGAALTAYELGQAGVPHTVVSDNSGGHLLQRGAVDVVIVGADRVTAWGDVANKIGTYLKALAAKDAGVPFLVAVPSPTIDFAIHDGIAEIPIEERDGDEVARVRGTTEDGRIETVRIVAEGSPVANHAFDVTPARLVTALVTERGVLAATEAALAAAFPERAAAARAVSDRDGSPDR